MPEAINQLEAYLRRTEAGDINKPTQIYSVAVCGERLPFEKAVTLPQLQWDFKPEWEQSEFFIAPTHLNCDGDLDGRIVGTVERLGNSDRLREGPPGANRAYDDSTGGKRLCAVRAIRTSAVPQERHTR